MAEQKKEQEKELLDKELEEVAGGVLGVGNPQPKHYQDASAPPPPTPRPRRD